MPAPIAPWMSASEALTIWMFSTAMKAPSVAPITAIQVLVETAGVAGAATAGMLATEAAFRAGWSVLMEGLVSDTETGCIRRIVSVIEEAAGRIVRQDLIMLPKLAFSLRWVASHCPRGAWPPRARPAR